MTLNKSSDGMYHLVGSINEQTPLETLAQATGVIKLNFSSALTLTSLGTKKLKALVDKKVADGIEYHECPRWFVDQLNALPIISEGQEGKVDIVSVYTPFQCTHCSVDVDALIIMKDVYISANEAKLPAKRCHVCAKPMKCKIDPHDYFLFLGSDA